jgi:hypothetical protein
MNPALICIIRTKNQIRIAAISTSAVALEMSQVVEVIRNILGATPGITPVSTTHKAMEKPRINKDMSLENLFEIDINAHQHQAAPTRRLLRSLLLSV